MSSPASPASDRAPLVLGEAATRADRALDQIMPGEAAEPVRLHRAMRYSVFAGGKRLRPALVLAAHRLALAVSGRPASTPAIEARLDAAMASVELLHTYTLIHDDLPAMDNDDLRRGRPTCHKAFDEATAILAGDALQCLAFGAAAQVGLEAVQVLCEAAGSLGVIGGQQDDCDATARWQRLRGDPSGPQAADAVLIAALERIHQRKTAALICASCQLGAISAGADAAVRGRLRTFGDAIGLAFQIADDILDQTATSQDLGKTAGKDAAQGKLTYVAVFGIDAARRKARAYEEQALQALTVDMPHASDLLELAHFVVRRRN
jgi:geranylgeranyl pyrophosphate synthase